MQFLLLCILICTPIVRSQTTACAKWSTTGVTIAGTGVAGNSSHQLHTPQGIFIDKLTNTLYVADFSNQRVQKFSLDASSSGEGVTVASGSWWMPYDIYVDTDDSSNKPIVYIVTFTSYYPEKWIEGATHGEHLPSRCRSCSSISVDKNKNVYLSSASDACVYQWSPQTNTTNVVAGHEQQPGLTDGNLYEPRGIYVDEAEQTVYVADLKKNHVQKWSIGANEGPTVAGSRASQDGSSADLLYEPMNIQVDEETKVLYIADKRNHRIQRWLPAALAGDTLVGGRGEGDAADQLRYPTDLAFDRDGNLYVCDSTNNRIQRFQLLESSRCKSASATNFPMFKVIILFCVLSVGARLNLN